MKRIVIYVLLIALTVLAPVKRVDVGTLKPVEVVALSKENELLVIRTDTADEGRGTDLRSALKDIKQSAIGVVYLETTRYLLYTAEVKTQAKELREDLGKKTKAFLLEGELDLKDAAKYLDVHGKAPK